MGISHECHPGTKYPLAPKECCEGLECVGELCVEPSYGGVQQICNQQKIVELLVTLQQCVAQVLSVIKHRFGYASKRIKLLVQEKVLLLKSVVLRCIMEQDFAMKVLNAIWKVIIALIKILRK